jgi:hypothetical protein
MNTGLAPYCKCDYTVFNGQRFGYSLEIYIQWRAADHLIVYGLTKKLEDRRRLFCAVI